ncbi:hypothetical protein BH11PSE8_BH11PSE8_34920 [soil metagenome]
MLTSNKLLPQGRGLSPVLLKRAARVELDWDVRQKSRFDATDSQGRALGVFLPRGTVVRGGDVLVAEDGSLILVEAAAQKVMVVTHCTEHGAPFDLLRAAYHLGNRHVALQLEPDHIQLEPDHVLAGMLRQMHLIVNEREAPFEPESGAYSSEGPASASHAGHGHSHDTHAGHDHAHDTAPGHTHSAPVSARKTIPMVAAPAPHVHGPGCGHEHSHDHPHDHDHGHRH